MPQYQVTAVGFYNGVMYDPDGKRKTLTTDKPFPKDKIPSWLKAIKPETTDQKKKREAAEKKAAEEAADKADADEKDIADASFLGEGESAEAGSTVETI